VQTLIGDMTMTLPAANHPCWQRLATSGTQKLKTQHLGTQLLLKRLERSADPVPAKAAELHAFFTKWERILANEVQQLATL